MERDDRAWLAKLLGNQPMWVWKYYAKEWEKSGDARAAAPLHALLKGEALGEDAAQALAQAGDLAVLLLYQALKNQDRAARCQAAAVLGKIGDRRAVQPLCEALKDESWSVRAHAIEALGRIGDYGAVPPLVELLEHREWSVRTRVAEALGRIADPRAVPPLIGILGHPGSDTRREAAEALEQIGPPAIPPLCEALRSAVLPVRTQAARILGRIGDARAVLSLCDALRRGQIEAAAALGEIALREPVAELLAAVPLLQQRLQALRFFDSTETQRTLRVALERTEQAMTSIRSLPIPAAAPLPTADALPVPASPPQPTVESLPVPAGAGAHTSASILTAGAAPGSSASQARGETGSRAALQRWWQRLKGTLRRQ
jgi:HEAT repeat protein